MHLIHCEGKSVIAERFIRTLEGKIYKRMTANDSKSYLSYLTKVMDQHNNTCHQCIFKKPIEADNSALTEKIETKASKFKVRNRVRITKYKNVFGNSYTENWSREIFIIDSVLKTKLWAYKLKILTKKK